MLKPYSVVCSIIIFSLASINGWSASCCGGGSASTLVLPKFSQSMADISFDMESYDGYWDQQGEREEDPAGSDVNQYRINFGYAHRLGDRWQGSVVLPYVYNDNQYSGFDSSSDGLGDAQLNLWYEAFDGVMCVTKVNQAKDLLPAAYFGFGLTVPTGVSIYDDVSNNFDITGRGMYRLDANISLEKSIASWNAVFKHSYGKYLKRDYNREKSKYVEPQSIQFGDRTLTSIALGFSHYIETMDSLTYTVSYAYLKEKSGELEGERFDESRMEKKSVTASVAYATLSRDWVYRFSWNHSLEGDGKGRNFPITDVYTLGVSHVFK